jgi:tRNA pseudouridine55 synthase
MMSGISEGLYSVIKPPGITSYDVIRRIKKNTEEKKIGHAGTLDPAASGVLLVAIGRKFTRELTTLSQVDKTYLAEITLGIETDSYDLDGKVTSLKMVPLLSEDEVKKVLLTFEGEIEQTPPIYSAKKIKGKKLYEYARKGQSVDIPSRMVLIHSIKLISSSLESPYPTLLIRVTVSKGTYVRSLAYDIGQKLGVGGVLSHLVRESVGTYCIADARGLDELCGSSS